MEVQGEQKEKGTENLLKEIITEKFLNLRREMYIKTHEA